VIRPDGTRVIRRIIPFNSCMAGTCGFPAQNLAVSRSAPSSVAAAPMLELAAPAPTLSDLLADRREPLHTLLPDVPWYVLQYARCGPPGSACPATIPLVTPPYTYSTAPYNAPLVLHGTPPVPVGKPNPNNPSPNPNHDNVMRHWATMSAANPVQVYIVVPETAAAAATTDIFATTIGAAGPYFYSQWVNDITATFNKYVGLTTADIHVNVTPVYSGMTAPFDPVVHRDIYDPPPPTPVPLPAPFSGGINASGHLIWDWSGGLGGSPNGTGPTGNGFNEIIFLRNRPLGSTGLTSMDLDPATGAIIECDVVFSVAAFAGQIPGGPYLPSETTAFVHEVGHFFGLDHTNLHPGPPLPATQVVIAGITYPSWMSYTRIPSFVPTEYPGMVAGITGFAGANIIAQQLHIDDAAGASRIYPVPAPQIGSPKVPLINTTAEIRGYVAIDGLGGGRFGDNVFPLERAVGSPFQLNPPDPNPAQPRIGTISGTGRPYISDVVGSFDTAANTTSSGGFRILGVPAPVSLLGPPYGTQYDIVAEDMAYLGFPGISGAPFGEWVSPNPPAQSILNPGSNAIVSQLAQTRFHSYDGPLTSSPGSATPQVASPIVGSWSVLPGTILDVGTLTHPGIGPIQVEADATSRPLVGIFPRTRPSSGQAITLYTASNYPLSTTQAKLTVNGITFNLLQAGVTVNSPAPGVIEVIISPALVATMLAADTPARLRLTAIEAGPPPAGLQFRHGINEVQY
jgi:hypothetical protein